MSDPWFKFYPTDWRSDPRLRMCSMAARGLWIEMIALMHEATPYGHLLVSGLSPTDTQLAVLAGAPSDQISELLGELESAGVFSRTGAGVIYSRKMARIAKKAAIARKNGKNGGNPTLRKERKNTASDNQIETDMVKPQKPEARSQMEKKEPNGSQKKRASRLPDDWRLPKDWGDWSVSEGLGATDVRLEADKFRDYWLAKAGKDASKMDWEATWRNWTRKAISDRHGNPTSQQSKASKWDKYARSA